MAVLCRQGGRLPHLRDADSADALALERRDGFFRWLLAESSARASVSHVQTVCARGSEPGLSQILQPKRLRRQVREAKHTGALAFDHRLRYLEAGWIQGESSTQGLYERLFQAPEPVEDIRLLVSRGCGQRALFPRTVNAARDTVEIPAGSAHLQIYAKPVPTRESDQSVLAAVAQIEALA